MGRVAVPLWLIILSDQLPVIALVGFYPANKLIGRRPIPKRLATLILRSHPELANLSASYARLRQSTYVLLTRSPLVYCYTRSTCMYKARRQRSS